MKRRRHTPEQIIRKLRKAERMLGEGKQVPEATTSGRSTSKATKQPTGASCGC